MTDMGLRERKNLRTRQAIVRAAAELTLEEDFAAATISRIAERADVAPRTVSTWFPVKEEILLGRPTDVIERAERQLSATDATVVERLTRWIHEERDEGGHSDLGRDLTLLRDDAVEHDRDLRARHRQAYESLHTVIAEATADELGRPHGDVGALMFAGAALTMLFAARDRDRFGGKTPGDTLADGLATLERMLDALR